MRCQLSGFAWDQMELIGKLTAKIKIEVRVLNWSNIKFGLKYDMIENVKAFVAL